MKLTLNYCTINDVMMVDPKKGDEQKKNRKVILHVDEEDFFDMLDNVNPKNIIKYHGIRHGLYNMNQRNKKKLNRALELLDNLKTEGKA